MSEAAVGRKWKCEYCTYENWAAAKRCTVCRALRTPQFISDEAPTSEGQDIYKMAPLICSPPERSSPPPHSSWQQSDSRRQSPTPSSSEAAYSSNKWPCQACTYLNWPRATKCTQCLTPRPKAVPVLTKDVNQPLSINVQGAASAVNAIGSRNNSPKNSPKLSPTSPEEAKALNNDRNRAIAASISNPSLSKHAKWRCRACTYENWPKSVKCVICGVAKGKIYTETAASDQASSLSPVASSSKKSNRRSPPPAVGSSRPSSRASSDSDTVCGASAAPPAHRASSRQGSCDRSSASTSPCNERNENNKSEESSQVRQIRTRVRDSEWLWLNACQGVVHGDIHAVEAYLASGGDVSRQLTRDECQLLNRPSAFEAGYTLVHLAIRFQREDLLSALLTAADVVKKAKKRMPCHVAPDIASEILRNVSANIRQRKGDFPCYFLTELTTFALPADIDDLPMAVRKQLFSELLDQNVQKELEDDEPVINWSLELTSQLNSRLYALWNRTAGDCLLDSVLQASMGIFDRDNTLRRALADSLVDGQNMFYPRWKECEVEQAEAMHFSLDESQWQQDWHILLNLASQPGVYLPLLWEQSFCFKTPIALGYTRGHFSALVPMEVDLGGCLGAGANLDSTEDEQMAYLPLVDREGKLLPIHFLPPSEATRKESVLREWLSCCVTEGGLLVARQELTQRPLLVKQMMDEWLERYRRLAHMVMSKSQQQQAAKQQKQKRNQRRTAETQASSGEESEEGD